MCRWGRSIRQPLLTSSVVHNSQSGLASHTGLSPANRQDGHRQIIKCARRFSARRALPSCLFTYYEWTCSLFSLKIKNATWCSTRLYAGAPVALVWGGGKYKEFVGFYCITYNLCSLLNINWSRFTVGRRFRNMFPEISRKPLVCWLYRVIQIDAANDT